MQLPNKKRDVVSYENMGDELRTAFEEKYPHGYMDYMGDIIKVDKPDGTFFYAVSIEIPDAIYLVKISVKTDNLDDIENGLFKDQNDEGDDVDTEFPDNEGDFGEEQEEEEQED